MTDKIILVVGTYDTKNPELAYMAERIRAFGGGVLTMDIGVLGEPESAVDYSKRDVAEAGGSSIEAAVDAGHENAAMQIMAAGASVAGRPTCTGRAKSTASSFSAAPWGPTRPSTSARRSPSACRNMSSRRSPSRP